LFPYAIHCLLAASISLSSKNLVCVGTASNHRLQVLAAHEDAAAAAAASRAVLVADDGCHPGLMLAAGRSGTRDVIAQLLVRVSSTSLSPCPTDGLHHGIPLYRHSGKDSRAFRFCR
jgi:hypothetical protein